MTDKPFLTVNKQIKKLKSQGLHIYNIKHANDILLNHSYYSFVNGYCDLLVKSKSPRIFKSGAKFKELEAIYDFDTGFRRFLFPQILFIEEKIKAICINRFCGKKVNNAYINNQDKYLDITSYDTINTVKLNSANKLINDFNSAINSNLQNRNSAFVHYNANYGYIPFWVLATNLSFGQVSRFFECLHYDVRNDISQTYGLNEKDLRTTLKILNTIRNVCAHNNRAYIVNIPTIFSPNVGQGTNVYNIDPQCNHKFGSVLYALKFLLSANKFKKVIEELGKELTILKNSLSTIRIQDVLLKMGISSHMVATFGITILKSNIFIKKLFTFKKM